MEIQICHDEQRRDQTRARPLYGLDYVEVSDDQLTLTVYFLGKAPQAIAPASVRVEGGRRIRGIQVTHVQLKRQADPELDDYMLVSVDKYGDFSPYTLRIAALDEHGRPTDQPPADFDPRYAQVEFSFKAGCASDLDCLPDKTCPPTPLVEPEINYLAKDYSSFRQLILDRLALIMPDWQERHVPDVGIALVELLAYAGDYLSYYQDAVATEAYLETARQRISVRRHARLVDYALHEGCNARAWVCVETDTDLTPDDLKGAYFITGYNDALPVSGNALTTAGLRDVPASTYEVFEPMSAASLQLYAAHSRMCFYTWGDRECCLPRGATSATLKDELCLPPTSEQPSPQGAAASASDEPQRKLHLNVGDILIFEEVIGPRTGLAADADPTHRHAVRLTSARQDVDPLNGQLIVEIEWDAQDALPFPLCISAIGPAPECAYLQDISVARGNVILVDHGQTISPPEDLGQVPVEQTSAPCDCEGHPGEVMIVPGRFRPQLKKTPLTFAEPLPTSGPASDLLAQDPRLALPQIDLTGSPPRADQPPQTWTTRPDLFGSGPDSLDFVVEMDDDRRAHLRFGDGDLGKLPEAGTKFTVTYRVGNGAVGNVGAEAISRIVFPETVSGANLSVRNPLPAQGGVDPEPLGKARLMAPSAFRQQLQRAITADDYASLAGQNRKVQRAAAILRWTGSWYEAQVAIDPFGSEQAPPDLLDEIRGYLYRYRRIGHDLAVLPAEYVSLYIQMIVCVLPHYLRGHVKAALLDLLSNRVLPNGKRGFFHPDNLTFGEGVYLSKLVATVQSVPGVETVEVTAMQRQFARPNHELDDGVLPLGPLQVARLDNDPNFPEHGKLVLDVRGGR
jgi:hypothetical protein